MVTATEIARKYLNRWGMPTEGGIYVLANEYCAVNGITGHVAIDKVTGEMLRFFAKQKDDLKPDWRSDPS